MIPGSRARSSPAGSACMTETRPSEPIPHVGPNRQPSSLRVSRPPFLQGHQIHEGRIVGVGELSDVTAQTVDPLSDREGHTEGSDLEHGPDRSVRFVNGQPVAKW